MRSPSHHPFSTVLFVFCALLLGAGARAEAKCATSDECKTMFVMAYISNLSGDVKWNESDSDATNEKKAREATSNRIDWALENVAILDGAWTREWGPSVIFKEYTKKDSKCPLPVSDHPHPVPANTMFVAKNGNEYVVAVAGTNPVSRYDWCLEDLAFHLTSWPTHAGVNVTKATLTGLRELDGMGLLTYLSPVLSDADATIYVTGHSLGGALAPALALWLKDTYPGMKATLKAYAFAGPTPGDQTFWDHMNSQFTGDELVVVNNKRDVVPHAWNHETFKNIKSLYDGDEGADIKVCGGAAACTGATFIDILAGELIGTHYKTLGTPGANGQQQPIKGELIHKDGFSSANCTLFFGTTVGPNKCYNVFGQLCKECNIFCAPKLVSAYYGAEMLYQHVCAYPNQLGLPDLNSTLCEARNKYDPAGVGKCTR